MNHALITLSAEQRRRLQDSATPDSKVWNTLRRAVHARPVVLGARNIEYVVICDAAIATELRNLAASICPDAIETIDLACRTASHHTQVQNADPAL
jgi:hypothetical protein